MCKPRAVKIASIGRSASAVDMFSIRIRFILLLEQQRTDSVRQARICTCTKHLVVIHEQKCHALLHLSCQDQAKRQQISCKRQRGLHREYDGRSKSQLAHHAELFCAEMANEGLARETSENVGKSKRNVYTYELPGKVNLRKGIRS